MNTKKQLEKYLKRKISDSTYFRIKRVMSKNNLPITKDNLQVVATIKTECSKHRIPLELGLAYYLKINIQTSINGKQLFEYIQNLTRNKPHRITITRWFIDGYEPEKIYSSVDVSKVLLSAFLYNLRSKNNDTQQKSNRSGTLSSQKIK